MVENLEKIILEKTHNFPWTHLVCFSSLQQHDPRLIYPESFESSWEPICKEEEEGWLLETGILDW